MSREIKNRLELLVMSGVAAVGMFICKEQHMWCGHVEHSSHDRIESWIFDSIWIFALCSVAVVGTRGRFYGARPIGIICALLILVTAVIRTPLGYLGGSILAILAFVQLVELALHILRRNKAEQGGDGDAEEAV
jgi:hypothetical protein